MARYVVHVRSPKSVEESFAYMADLTNFQEWDPGVLSADQVRGEGPGPGAAYDVEVKGVPRPLTLTYRLITYEAPHRFVAKAKSKMLSSVDTIEVRPDDRDGSIVTYDAELTLAGVLAAADPLLKRAFDGIGDRAANGLVNALDGERVEAPA
jgi:hypothetical protein